MNVHKPPCLSQDITLYAVKNKAAKILAMFSIKLKSKNNFLMLYINLSRNII